MRIGVVSDTHNRYAIVMNAVALLTENAVEYVLHCGDIEDAKTVQLFRGLKTHFVLGNCDYDEKGLRQAMRETGATFHENYGHLELGGRKIAWIHGHRPRLFQDVEMSGAYDFLFYGHSHQAEEHRTGPTRVINPGALHRAPVKTFVILDLADGNVKSVVVE